ncbi:hypothetical protein FPV67DRAFT_1454560 [Lyophyllum atratum]|nr:hypothetical protein FPV67DRAFT_1454560 [Lyophyllum atratum]
MAWLDQIMGDTLLCTKSIVRPRSRLYAATFHWELLSPLLCYYPPNLLMRPRSTRSLKPKENLLYNWFKDKPSTARTSVDIDHAGRSLVSILDDRNEKNEVEIADLRKALHNVETDMAKLKARSQQVSLNPPPTQTSLTLLGQDLHTVTTKLFEAQHQLSQKRCSALEAEEAHNLREISQELHDLREASRGQENATVGLLKELQDLRGQSEKLKELEIANDILRQQADERLNETARLSKARTHPYDNELCGSQTTLRHEVDEKVSEIARLTKELTSLRLLPEKLKDSEKQYILVVQRVKKVEEGYILLERELDTRKSERQTQLQRWKSDKDELAMVTQQAEILRAIVRAVRSLFECCVCYTVMRTPTRLNCGHMFCIQCINQWSNTASTCPSCRMEFQAVPDPLVIYGYPEAGFLVDARTFRKHAKEDIKQGQIDAYAASTEAAARATAKHEAEVIDALGRLNIANSDASSFPGAVEPLSRLPHNNVERAKKMLRDADMVQDTLASLKRQISDIGVAPSIVDRSSIDRALGELNSIASSIALESTKLQTISFVKTPAVVAIHRQVYLCLQDVEADCRGAIETWRVVLEKLDEEHFAQGKHHQPLFEGVKPLLQVVMLMVTVCHVVLRLPRRGTFWLFTLTKYIIEFAVKKALNSDYLPDYFNNLVENFPRDIRAAGKPFTVDGKSEVYATFPSIERSVTPRSMAPAAKNY